MKCTFANPGTYGHECGADATHVAVKLSTPTPNLGIKGTESGFFYAGRCPKCLAIKGGENAGVLRFEEANEKHVNRWVRY